MPTDFRERERNTDVVNIDLPLPASAPTGDQTCNPGVCPDQEPKPQCLSLWDNAPTNGTTMTKAVIPFL